MRNAKQEEAKAGIKIAGRNINNLRYAMLHLHTCPEESANCENDGEDTHEPMTISLLLWMSFIRITDIC